MAAFWQDPLGWLKNEKDRAATAYYSPNPEAKKAAAETSAGQSMDPAAYASAFSGDGGGQTSATDAVDKTIAANRPDVNGPFGNIDWTKNQDGTWTMNQGFTGPLGGVAGSLQSQLAGIWGQPMMTGDKARQQAIEAAYGQSTSRLDPRFAREEEALRTRLVNQGLDPQSEAYVQALREFGLNKNDAYSSAMNSAIGQGTAAGQAVFNQDMQARNAPLQELIGLKGLLPGQGGASGGDYMSALQNQQQQQASQNQFWTDLLGGLVKLGTAIV